MENNGFNLDTKISELFERFSRIFKVMQWDVAKKFNISPIQAQFLIFIKKSHNKFCTVLNLANEFGIKPSTVSDAIKSLEKKGYVVKEVNPADKRNFFIKITKEGKELENKIKNWDKNFVEALKKIPKNEKLMVYKNLLKILIALQENDGLFPFQTCLNCENLYKKKKNKKTEYFCGITEKKLQIENVKFDSCNKFKKIDIL